MRRLAVLLARVARTAAARFGERLDARLQFLTDLDALAARPAPPLPEPEPLSPAAVAQAYRLLEPARRR